MNITQLHSAVAPQAAQQAQEFVDKLVAGGIAHIPISYMKEFAESLVWRGINVGMVAAAKLYRELNSEPEQIETKLRHEMAVSE